MSAGVKAISLDHLHVYAKDPERSAAFYERHFGATPVHRNQNAHGDLRIFLALGGQILVVGSFPGGMRASAPPAPGDGAYTHGFGVAHFGLRVESVTEAVSTLEAEGVEVLSTPIREETGLVYAYVAAPDGVVLELTQYDDPA